MLSLQLAAAAAARAACSEYQWTEPVGLNYTTKSLAFAASAAYAPNLVLGDCIGSREHPCTALGSTGSCRHGSCLDAARGFVVSSAGSGMAGGGMVVLEWEDRTLVAFAGTDVAHLSDLEEDFDVPSMHWRGMNVHSGFLKRYASAYRCATLDVAKAAAKRGIGLTLVGHSSGGAVAELAAFDVWRATGARVDVVSFGAPKVADTAFETAYTKILGTKVRVVTSKYDFPTPTGDDPVSDVPLGYIQPQPPNRLYLHCFLTATVELHRIATYRDALPACPQTCRGGGVSGCVCRLAASTAADSARSVAMEWSDSTASPAAVRYLLPFALLLLLALYWRRAGRALPRTDRGPLPPPTYQSIPL